MANPKPLMAQSSGTDPADAAVHSALRTLDAEGGGIAAISAALQSDLRAPFAAAADLIRNAKGRLIVTGLGKSGHVARKIAATFASTGTPAFFVHAAEASHGDLGMITADDVILALSWSGEQPEMKNLINYAARFRDCRDRDDGGAGILARPRRPASCWRCRRRARPVRTISRRPPPR